MAQLNFDARTVEPATTGGSALPISDKDGHPVVIVASEMKENSAKTGGYLELMLQIIDGPFKGQEGPYRLNLFHTNEQTVSIAYKQLSAICHVCNVFQVADSAQLHNIPFRAVVGLQKKQKADDPDYTEVKGVKDINGNDPGKTGNTVAAPAAAVPPASFPATPQPAAAAQPAWNAQPAAPAAAAPGAPPWGAQPAAGAATPPWGAK